MPSLTMNLVKRIDRLPKPRRSSDAMQPLFEAISNSIQATREKYEKAVGRKGRIYVEINTDRKNRFTSALIQDNGPGLDKKNYAAFLETDTDNKIQIGGKGVGRLLWLDCFEKIHIDTHYRAGGSIKTRKFNFKLSPADQVQNLKEGSAESSSDTGFVVRFNGLRNNEYRQKFPGRPMLVVQHLASHFLPMFIGENCPQITVECGKTYEYPEAINELIHQRKDVENIKSGKFGTFTLALMQCDKVASSDLKGTHFVHFIAHDRTVRSQAIDNKLGIKRFGDGARSVFHACLFGSYLNKNVNQERTGFNFEEAVIEEIINNVCMPEIEEFLRAPLTTHKEKQKKIVSEIVENYPSVEFGSAKELQKVVPLGELSKDAIYGHLSRERFRRDQRQGEVIRTVIQTLSSPDAPPKEFYSKIAKAAEAVGKAEQKSLAEYVVRRKAVLDLLELLIQSVRQTGGDSSYQRESVLHSFICPLHMRTVGSERKIRPAPSHELWVVDERLTYTQYFSSDLPLKELHKRYDSNERPDLLIFDRVHGLRQSDKPSRVLLIEFKRPGRKDYEAGENPRDQVEGYVTRLLAGGEFDVEGRPIKLTADTTFYCYIVADDVGRMSEWTRTWAMTPDGRGRFYEPSNGFKGRVELLGWDALIGDARERHKAFFDRAGIRSDNIFQK